MRIYGTPNNIGNVGYYDWLLLCTAQEANILEENLSVLSFLKGEGWQQSWLTATFFVAREGHFNDFDQDRNRLWTFRGERVFYLAFRKTWQRDICREIARAGMVCGGYVLSQAVPNTGVLN